MIPKEVLKEIIASQRDFLDRSERGTRREEGKKIRIEPSFALIITGVRRCGKSTFLNQLLKSQKRGYYLNLEDPRLDGFELSDFNRAESAMKELYGEGGIYFFDEIQNVERWEKFVRYLVDKKERVIITGSNASMLSRELGTKLTGRYLRIEMFPFSYREFLRMRSQNTSSEALKEYLTKGGFPEYLKKENPEILHELLSDIAMKDIAIRYGIKNTSILIKIVIHLISSVGKEFSYNSIKKMLGIKSVQSVIDYIAYIENAYLIFTVPRFSYSYKQQQIAPKKVYSVDNGFSQANSTSFSKDRGRMLENAVFLSLRQRFKEIFYYHGSQECDFVIREKGKINHAIQTCWQLDEENKDRELSGLVEALRYFKLKEGLILTYNQEDAIMESGKRIIIKPAWRWLLK